MGERGERNGRKTAGDTEQKRDDAGEIGLGDRRFSGSDCWNEKGQWGDHDGRDPARESFRFEKSGENFFALSV